MSSNTVFLLVPGSFSKPILYEKMVPLFTSQGYEVEATTLPSCGERSESEGGPANMFDDARHLQSVITRLADQGKDIVMAMSSYGGFPGSEAAKGLSKTEREKQGKKGGLVGLVYIASFLAPVGVSINDIQKPEIVKDAEASTDPYMDLDRDVVWQYVFNDLPESEARYYMSTAPRHSRLSFNGAISYPAYQYIPSIYFHCKNDNIVPPERQLKMIKEANDIIEKEGGQKVRVWESDAGHVPMTSVPKEVVEACIAAAKGW